MRLVYIVGPFRAANAWEREQNIRKSENLALEVWRLGVACICPHTNTRFFEGAAPDYVWLEGYLEILTRCDAILMVPGWDKSSGSIEEHKKAKEINIKILYSINDLKEWLKQTTPSKGLQYSNIS